MSRLLRKITKQRLLKRTNKFPRKSTKSSNHLFENKIKRCCRDDPELKFKWKLVQCKEIDHKVKSSTCTPRKSQKPKKWKKPSEQEQEQEKLVIDGSSSSAFLSYENKPNWIHENQFASVSQSGVDDGRTRLEIHYDCPPLFLFLFPSLVPIQTWI